MEEFLHVLLHALEDTAKLVPFLVIVYFLIELLESKELFKFEKSKLLNGKASPVIGALCGSVPQCGFSVISSELFAKQKISAAALVSVFIATSDEAVPIMLSNYKSIPALLLLVLTKIIIAIIVGYITYLLYGMFFKQPKAEKLKHHDGENKHNDHSDHEHDEHHEEDIDNGENHEHIHACCNHDFKHNKFNWKHPVIHSLKITLYIFIVNLVMGGLVEWIGESNISEFLNSSYYFQPLIAIVVGFIPNCASSVILTELYLMGGLSFGSIVAGLSVNAGLGLLMLFKENKNMKQNLFITAVLLISSIAFGYALHFIPFNFLKI